MKKIALVVLPLVAVAFIFAGCSKTEETKAPEVAPAPAAVVTPEKTAKMPAKTSTTKSTAKAPAAAPVKK